MFYWRIIACLVVVAYALYQHEAVLIIYKTSPSGASRLPHSARLS